MQSPASAAWLPLLVVAAACGGPGPAVGAGAGGAAGCSSASCDTSAGEIGVAGSAGESLGGATAGQGSGGSTADGCVDLRIDGSALDQTLSSSAVSRTPFWLDAKGAHVPWLLLPDAQALVVSTVGWNDLESVRHDQYEVFPKQIPAGDRGFFDAVGEPQGSFAIAWGFRDAGGATTSQHVLLGDTADATSWTSWSPETQWYPAVAFHLGWDGEAFAIHLASSQSSDLRLARVSATRTLLNDVDRAGTVGPVGYNDADFATDSGSGKSWMIFSASRGVKLTGHDRAGSVAAVLGDSAELAVLPDGAETPNLPGSYPALAFDLDGLMLVWTDSHSTTWLQHLDDSLVSTGPALAIPPEQLGDPERFPPAELKDKTAYRHDGRWYVAASNQHTVELFAASESEITDRWTILQSSRADDCLTDWGCDLLSIRSLEFAEWNGELWLGFLDYSENNVDEDPFMLPFQSAYRIVKVKEGCSYKTLWDIRREL